MGKARTGQGCSIAISQNILAQEKQLTPEGNGNLIFIIYYD
jgi:hypothetical protein